MQSIRRLFQLRLLTVIVLSLVAAGLLWANLRFYDVEKESWTTTFRGWPCGAMDYGTFMIMEDDGGGWAGLGRPPREFKINLQPETRWQWLNEYKWRKKELAINIATAGVLLFIAGAAIEYWLRRRTGAGKQNLCASAPLR